MKNSNKRVEYVNSYIRTNYDRIMLLLPKGTKESLRQKAIDSGISMNRYILGLIENSR